MEKRKHIVILAAGDYPTHPEPLRALHDADMVVCCDSAYRQWKVESKKWKEEKPFVVIGDGDSLSEADRRALGDRWIEVSEQDYNDLHKAMSWVMSEVGGRKSEADNTSCLRHQTSDLKVTILGATGHREDHTLGNISYLVTFAEEYPGADIEMLTDYGRVRALTGRHTIATFPGQQLSFFAMEPDHSLYGQGLKWPLDGFRASRWWQGTLNEALGNSVSLRAEGWWVLYQTYEAKKPSA